MSCYKVLLANLIKDNRIEIKLGEQGTIFLFKIHKIVFAYVSVFYAIDIKNIIPEMYRPLLTSRNFISDYLSNVATFTISTDGDVKTIKVDNSNYVGSFCYFTL